MKHSAGSKITRAVALAASAALIALPLQAVAAPHGGFGGGHGGGFHGGGFHGGGFHGGFRGGFHGGYAGYHRGYAGYRGGWGGYRGGWGWHGGWGWGVPGVGIGYAAGCYPPYAYGYPYCAPAYGYPYYPGY